MATALRRRINRQTLEATVAYVLIFPPVLIIFGMFFFPAARSFFRTLVNDSGAFSLQRYADFFANPVSVSSLRYTLEITTWSTVGLFLICLPLAFYLRFSTGRLASWVQSVAMIPLFVPGIMSGYALIRFLRPRGMLETLLYAISPALADSYDTPYLHTSGIVFGLIWESIPFTVLVLNSGLRSVNNGLLESARDVGAGWLHIIRFILIPLAWPSLLIAFTLNVIGFIGAYTIPFLLGPAAPYPIAVHMQLTFGNFGRPIEAETQAVVMFIISVTIGFLYVSTVSRKRYFERD